MEQINCLNFCDITSYLQSKQGAEEILSLAMKEAGYETCERIYLGSSFCGKYFIQQSETNMKEWLQVCKEYQIKVTIVIPTFSEGDLEQGKKKVEQLLCLGDGIIDECTVNDYGMLFYLHQNHKIAKNLGRLFMKDYRDIRYQEYFQIPWKLKMFTNHMTQVLKECDVKGCEIDLTHKLIDLSDVPEGVTVGIHAPYCYQTVGRICEFASVSKPIHQKFRADDYCDEGCSNGMIQYHSQEEGIDYLRCGRTVYFKHLDYQLKGILKYRLIYFPIDMKANSKV